MFSRVVNRFLDSRLSFVLLTGVFCNVSWRCVGMFDSFQFRKKGVLGLGIRLISPLVFVVFNRKLPI